MVILNLSENLHGAYIYRNGLPCAVRLFLPPEQDIRPIVTAFQELRAPSESVMITCEQTGYALTFESPYFRVNARMSADGNLRAALSEAACLENEFYEACRTGDRRLRVNLLHGESPTLYYTRGGLKFLPDCR